MEVFKRGQLAWIRKAKKRETTLLNVATKSNQHLIQISQSTQQFSSCKFKGLFWLTRVSLYFPIAGSALVYKNSNLQLAQRRLCEAHQGCYLGPFHNVQRIAVLYLGPSASQFLGLAGMKTTETIRFNRIKQNCFILLIEFFIKICIDNTVHKLMFQYSKIEHLNNPISTFITSKLPNLFST